MTMDMVCPIWGSQCMGENQGYATLVDSKRAGGRYFVRIDVEEQLRADVYGLTDREKAVLSTWIANQNRQNLAAVVSPELIQRVKNRELKPMNPYHRADALLRLMVDLCEPGHFVGTSGLFDDPEMLVLTESVSEADGELLVDGLVDKGLLYQSPKGGIVKVTLDGYQRGAEIDAPNTDSRQVFVTMWFNEATSALRESIKQAIEDAGLVPYIIDEDASYQNKICDKIEVEIRRSRLLVADFTHGDGGARGSVYYEAGLAKGLGIPIVWTCPESQIEDLHFDTNHYPHLGWTDDQLDDFRQRLSDRLSLLVAER